jgi:NAD(P)-dependent dehydrogenase (short-subunit alcohol dehydrogenase family)
VRLVKESVEQLGGLDIILNNAGWTRFISFGDLYDMSHDEWNKCWSTNVMSHLVLVQEAAPIFNKNPDGGVFIISSSVAVSIPGSVRDAKTDPPKGDKMWWK